MTDYWNEINLSVPSLTNYEATNKFDIEKFKKLFEDAVNYFSHMDDLNLEIEQVARFIFIGKEQFRMLRGFQEMKKTHQAAHRYQRMDMLGILEAFNSYISKSAKRLPFKQNLDYVLIKLQGLSKLLIRVVTCARNSTKFFLGFIRAGSFYAKGSLFVTSLSKIWGISRMMCKFSVILYNNLITFRDQLKSNEEIKWDANNCSLPSQLDEWLGSEYDELITNETYDFKMLTSEDEIKNFIQNREKNWKIFDEGVKDENSQDFEKVSLKIEDIKMDSNEIEDYTPIPRTKNIKKDDGRYIHSLDAIKSREHVKKFISTEDRYRKLNTQNSLTIKKVKNKGWKNFKNDLRTKLLLMQETTLIDYFHDHINEFLQ